MVGVPGVYREVYMVGMVGGVYIGWYIASLSPVFRPVSKPRAYPSLSSGVDFGNSLGGIPGCYSRVVFPGVASVLGGPSVRCLSAPYY